MNTSARRDDGAYHFNLACAAPERVQGKARPNGPCNPKEIVPRLRIDPPLWHFWGSRRLFAAARPLPPPP